MSHHNGIDEAKWVVDNIQKLMAQDRCVICIVCPLSLGAGVVQGTSSM